MHTLLDWLGLTNAAGKPYLWWSGFFGCVTIFGSVWIAVLVWARRHHCHVNRCWRWALHPVEGTPYITCRKHHPVVGDAPTHEEVIEAHRKARHGTR